MKRASLPVIGLVLLSACVQALARDLAYDPNYIPRFNIPRIAKPPVIDGWALRDVYEGTAILENRRRRLVEQRAAGAACARALARTARRAGVLC